jgi:RecG-like helicase
MPTDLGTGLRRALKKFTASPAELEKDELHQERLSHGCQQIASVTDRELVTVFGHVKNVSLAPRAGTPTLEAALYDGSGVITLVWLGRRRIRGIEPGVNLVATGRVSCQDGLRIMYNPRYELRI